MHGSGHRWPAMMTPGSLMVNSTFARSMDESIVSRSANPEAKAYPTNASCPDATIPFSNRSNQAAACRESAEGTECFFSCDPGYIPLGRHVCQWHDPKWVVDNSNHTDAQHNARGWAAQAGRHQHIFWGGRCEPLCSGMQSCPGNQSPRRYKKSAMFADTPANEDCMITECFPSHAENLENLARGVFDVMSMARDEQSGMYYNSINLNWFRRFMSQNGCDAADRSSDQWLREAVSTYQTTLEKNYSLDATAMGIISEVVGTALGFQLPSEAVLKVKATIGNLTAVPSGNSDGKYEFARDGRGFFSHFYTRRTMNTTSPLATGLLVAASLFARNYFSALVAGERIRVGGIERLDLETASARASLSSKIASLSSSVEELYDSIDFTSVLCDKTTKTLSRAGEGIPFTIGLPNSDHPNMCGKATNYPSEKDGLYEFNENHNLIYLAYQQACGATPAGQCCNNSHIELAWNRWQRRKTIPNHHYAGSPLLSTSGGYILHLLQYTTNSFNNDTRYQELLYNHWVADELFYKQALFAGKRGRYGLGEGPESKWCNEQKSYNSMHLLEKDGTITPGKREGMVVGSHSHCAAVSGNVVAAWLPANKDLVQQQLLHLLEDGETVEPIPCTENAFLWRVSLLDSKVGVNTGKGRDGRITLVDLAPSLFGLSTLKLEPSFYRKYSKHFKNNGSPNGPTTLVELQASCEVQKVAKGELDRAQDLLATCNAICERAGGPSGPKEKCTMNCASDLFFAANGKQTNLSTSTVSRQSNRTTGSSSDTDQLAQARVLLRCYSECGATSTTRDESSHCTTDCALHNLLATKLANHTANALSSTSNSRNHTRTSSRAKMETTRDLRELTRALIDPLNTQAPAPVEGLLQLTQEQVLLKCHSECDNGVTDSASVQQCAMDCALRHLNANRPALTNLTARAGQLHLANRANRPIAASQEHAEPTQEAVLLNCHDECDPGGTRDTASAEQCTMDCALRHLHASSHRLGNNSSSMYHANHSSAHRASAGRGVANLADLPGGQPGDETASSVGSRGIAANLPGWQLGNEKPIGRAKRETIQDFNVPTLARMNRSVSL